MTVKPNQMMLSIEVTGSDIINELVNRYGDSTIANFIVAILKAHEYVEMGSEWTDVDEIVFNYLLTRHESVKNEPTE